MIRPQQESVGKKHLMEMVDKLLINSNIDSKVIASVVEILIDEMEQALVTDRKFVIPNLGTFLIYKVKGSTSVDINTKQLREIKPYYNMRLNITKYLKTSIKKSVDYMKTLGEDF